MKLILIDGNALIHRAFHAIRADLQTSEGFPTNAIFGFVSMFLNILEKENPEYIAVTFDRREKTFRHEEYEDYKAKRVKAPQELYDQIPKIHEFISLLGIPSFSKAGFEADDMLGTISAKTKDITDLQTLIITSDQDILQLVSGNVLVAFPKKGYREKVLYTPEKVHVTYGIDPKQIPDLKGLAGDPSDNLKGVFGIGEKGASKLIGEFGSIENLYNNLPNLPDKVRQKLEHDRESAFMSKRLATIVRDVPIEFDLEKCRAHEFNLQQGVDFLISMEIHSQIKRLEKIHKLLGKNHAHKFDKSHAVQTSLFSIQANRVH